jgi:hypothetical protein
LVVEEGERMATTDDPDVKKPDALGRAASGGDDAVKARAKAARLAALAKVAELNRKHFVISNIGGKCLVGEFFPSSIDPNCWVLSFQAPTAFATRYGNPKVSFINEDDGSTSYRELGRYWLKHRDRRGFEGIELMPNGPPILPSNRLNLWRGWGVTPRQGEYPLIKSHLRDVLANGDLEAERYNWKWTAWAVQGVCG